MKDEPINLDGRAVSGDDAMGKVIDIQAKLKAAQRENVALRRDRDELLAEYTSMRDARKIVATRSRVRQSTRNDRIRVSAGDMHGMMMDRPAVDAFLGDLKTLAPDEIVLGGDFVECGGWLAKHIALGYVAQTDYSYQEDIGAANWFLDELAKVAPSAEVIMLEGNHEDRVERWCVDQTMSHGRDAEFLRRAFAPQYMLRLKARGIAYVRRSDKVDGLPHGWIRRGKMYFTHELTGGRNAASSAVARTGGNVTFFHTHQESTATLVLPGIGICKAFNPGCLCQRQPMWKHSDPSNWSHGYAIDIIAKSGSFQHIQVPIWEGQSLAGAMVERFKS